MKSAPGLELCKSVHEKPKAASSSGVTTGIATTIMDKANRTLRIA
jgi:hypothetical protein